MFNVCNDDANEIDHEYSLSEDWFSLIQPICPMEITMNAESPHIIERLEAHSIII